MTVTLQDIAFYSVLTPLLVAILRWKKIGLQQGMLAGFCAVAFGLQMLGKWLVAQDGTDLPNFHLYILIEFFVFAMIYCLEWKGRPMERIIYWIMGGFVLLAIYSAIWYPGLQEPPSLSEASGHLLLLAFAGIFMVTTLLEMRYERLEKEFMFWFSTGILIYFAGTILQSIFSGFLVTSSDKVYNAVWASRDIFTILFYIICSIGMLCKNPKT